MAKYTDEDVQNLVGIVQTLVFTAKSVGTIHVTPYKDTWVRMSEALKPFLPDPEDALIEKMARELFDYDSSGHSDWYWDEWQDHYRTLASISLKVMKQEGWRHGTD